MHGEASVCANVIENGTRSTDSTRCTRAGGTVAPPENAQRTLPRSVPPKPGWASRAKIMVGTPPNIADRSDSIRSSTSPSSKPGTRTWVNRPCTGPSVSSTQPAVWNSGIGLTHTSPGSACRICAQNRALLVIPRWRSTAPLGKPVVHGGDFWVTVCHEYASRSGPVRDAVEATMSWWMRKLEGLISAGIDQGQLMPCDPAQLAFEIQAVLVAGGHQYRLGCDPKPRAGRRPRSGTAWTHSVRTPSPLCPGEIAAGQ